MAYRLEAAALARLMPMHLALDGRGRITSAGGTLVRVLGEGLVGEGFFGLFELRGAARPSVAEVAAMARLHLTRRGRADLAFRGQAVPLGKGALVNLSFGIGVVEAVQRFGLTEADFAPTDLTVELLYLYEAKTAVLEELRALNLRLHGDKVVAEERAVTDALTGLGNRRALESALAGMAGAFALAVVDLDGFKAVNDGLGHAAGDHVLSVVARRLEAACRTGDAIVRTGGDEFVMLMPGMVRADAALRRMRRVIARLSEPIPWEGAVARIGASAGIVLAGGGGVPPAERLMSRADAALYAAKRAGKGRAVVWRAGLGEAETEASGGA
ncbi:MAG: hypothetical protein Q27BPR15_05980 [Rhodobacter sp. CACIA14H1]|nr:MAG: hypothetical protein Q27BPR15_05980 [Rhodobacter sp. CACIA14H1]